MTCQEFLARYSDYLDERMDALEAPDWRHHIETCPACARYDRILRQGLPLMRTLPHIEPSYDFFPRLQHRLYHVEEDLKTGSRPSGAGVALSLAVAGALAILAWGPVFGPKPRGAPTEVRATTARPTGTQTTEARPTEAWPTEVLATDVPVAEVHATTVQTADAMAPDARLAEAQPTEAQSIELLPVGEVGRRFEAAAVDGVGYPLRRTSYRVWSCSTSTSTGSGSTACWSSAAELDNLFDGFTAEAPAVTWPGREWPIEPVPSFEPTFVPVGSAPAGAPGLYTPLIVTPPVSERGQAVLRGSWSSTVSTRR